MAVKGPMVAKLVKISVLYMSGLAGPTVGLQEACVFAGNKVTRAVYALTVGAEVGFVLYR